MRLTGADRAQARKNTVTAEAAAYGAVKKKLDLSTEQLGEYRWYHSMMDSQEGKVLINMANNAIINL